MSGEGREIVVRIDPKTERSISAFTEPIGISIEDGAARLLDIAGTIRQILESKGLLGGGPEGDYVLSWRRLPDGSRKFEISDAPRTPGEQ